MHRYHGNLEVDGTSHSVGCPLGSTVRGWRIRLILAGIFLSAWFLVDACASSVYTTVKMQIDREMPCKCGRKPKIEEVSAVAGNSAESAVGQDRSRRTYQASCCAEAAIFECLPEVREQNMYTTVEDRGRMPTVDVIWRCWKVQEPPKSKAFDRLTDD